MLNMDENENIDEINENKQIIKGYMQRTRVLTDVYEGVQKERKQVKNRIDGLYRDHQISTEDAEKLHGQTDEELSRIEKDIKKEMESLVKKIPIYQVFLKDVVGIGPTFTTKLMAWIGDIERFPNIGKLWKYCGQVPVAYCDNCNKRYFNREEGEDVAWVEQKMKSKEQMIRERSVGKTKLEIDEKIADVQQKLIKSTCRCDDPKPTMKAEKPRVGIYTIEYNPKLKSLSWIISDQFVRQGRYYRQLYDDFKAEDMAKNPQLTDGHLHNRAKRKTVKIFLSHLWVYWREVEGLSITEPYAKKYLGHEVEMYPPRDEDGQI